MIKYKILFFFILYTSIIQTNEYLKQPVSIEQIKYDQSSKLKLNKINDASITTLYQWEKPLPLNIAKEQLANLDSIKLKKLFEDFEIVSGVAYTFKLKSSNEWTNEDWKDAYLRLCKRANRSQSQEIDAEEILDLYTKNINFDKLPELLKNAKSILKSFLIDNINIISKEQFIEKEGINRLFTYVKLKQTIEEKKILHINLPLKFLIIKDNESGKYLSKEEASTLIDHLIKIFITSTDQTEITLNYLSDKYIFIIFAHKQINTRIPFNKNTQEDLKNLVEEAPFDIGDDNIFTDDNGNAIIIDTELKNSTTKNSLNKLNRYFNINL